VEVRKHLVYVVDDDPSSRRGLCRLFKAASLEVEAFDSGEAFLAALEPGRGACLVSDILMPGMDGLALCAELRRIRPELPVILVTAWDEPHLAERAASAGASAYFPKPVGGDAFLEAVLRTRPPGQAPGPKGGTTMADITVPRKAAPRKTPPSGALPAQTPGLPDGNRMRMIQEAAYFLAVQRGFSDGDPVQDWLKAEQNIDRKLTEGNGPIPS
jgi:CheY-like chemotaxis protein